MRLIRCLFAALGALLALPAGAQTLAEVRARGELLCGVHGGLPGFSAPDAAGVMRGLDADFCRAVAAAVLGRAEAVRFLPMATPAHGLEALGYGRIDLLVRNTTQTLLREGTYGVAGAGVLFFDGMGVLVRADAGLTAFDQLDGKRICVGASPGSGEEAVLLAAARGRGMTVELLPTGPGALLAQAFQAGRCDAMASDASALAARRATLFADPGALAFLPERLSREPLGPLVRADDDAWRSVVFWVLQALLEAEEYDARSDNLIERLQDNQPALWRLLGVEPGGGQALGLPDDWAQQAIAQVGNYGEIFERNLGAGSPIGLARGLNLNWRRGGLMFPMPIR